MECSNGGNVMTGRDTILIVDDMEINRVILRGVFEADYNFLEAENRQSCHERMYGGRCIADPVGRKRCMYAVLP